jgi:predicted acylesterase/phospholipase RssA
MGNYRKSCSALGGGGARGSARLGTLSVLERERISVDFAAGTSRSAVVASPYASSRQSDFSRAPFRRFLEGPELKKSNRETKFQTGFDPLLRRAPSRTVIA